MPLPMGFLPSCLPAFIIFVVFCLEARILRCQNLTCSTKDLIALEGFSNCLESGVRGWNSSASADCCTWTGVTCDYSNVAGATVVGLDLGGERLSGKNCESLAGLYQLRFLNLSQNYLQGALPDALFRLPNLEVLDFSNNDFSGSISAGICDFSTGIRVLNFSSNSFTGEVPTSLGNCTSLQHLSLNENDLSGSFPESIFGLQYLIELHLQENMFTGPLSDGIGKLSNLVKLDISFNGFSGSLPDAFKGLEKLEQFSAGSNNFTGQFPASLVNSPSLQVLDVRNNSISGLISINCSAMASLFSLDLGSNYFQGPIPDSLSSCPKLTSVNLARNNLNSEIPDSFKNLQALNYFSISNAGLINISAALGVLQQCHNLSMLVLTGNFHDEEIAGDVNLYFRNLKALVIANCRLKGSIPLWLRNSDKLQLLDLSWNSLSGSIPSWIGNYPSFFYLDLSNNSFSGEIPKSLTELQRLKNRNTSIEDPFPSFPLYSRGNSAKGLKYKQIWSFRPSLDLGNNMLTGPIWPEFGSLKGLHVLVLKANNLSGTIPDSLSRMTSLETLDLSKNKLSGEIPSSFVALSFLSDFDVSYNQLSGEIPSGGQFLTFPNSSFVGNKGLCGLDFIPCQTSVTEQTSDQSPGEEMKIFGPEFGIGAATGFVITVTFCFMFGWVLPKSRKKERDEYLLLSL